MLQAEKGLDKFSKKMDKFGKQMTMKVTAPIAALGVSSFKMAGDFDQSFRKVNVMLKATEKEATPSHVHDYDEILGFIGSDPEHPHDLGGEVEYWMEDEKYILNKSCLIWIPKGLRHCPLSITRVDRPILFLAISMSKKYAKEGIIHAE